MAAAAGDAPAAARAPEAAWSPERVVSATGTLERVAVPGMPPRLRIPATSWPTPTAPKSKQLNVRGWRDADRRAAQWRRIRGRIFGGVALLLLALSVSGNFLAKQFTELDSALREERQRNVAMADSVEEYRVALDNRVRRVVEARPATRGTPALPIVGRVSSGFTTKRLHPVLNVWRPHRGIDIPAKAGTRVRPVAPGRVTDVGRDFGLGLFVDIDHGDVQTRYAHLQRTFVSPGDWVEPGTAVGAVGATGLATAPHLHYEVIVNEQRIDPLRHELRTVEIVPAAMRRVTEQTEWPSVLPSTPPPATDSTRPGRAGSVTNGSQQAPSPIIND